MTTTQARIIRLLAHSNLLPSYVSDPILAGNPPPLQKVVDALLIHAMDCEAMRANASPQRSNGSVLAASAAVSVLLERRGINTQITNLVWAAGDSKRNERMIARSCVTAAFLAAVMHLLPINTSPSDWYIYPD